MMPATTTAAQMKYKVKNHFTEVSEDKFTKIRIVKCKETIVWKAPELAQLMPENYRQIHPQIIGQLKMTIDYRHKENVDSVFFTFVWSRLLEGSYMDQLQMYLILDDDKTIALSDVSGHEYVNEPAIDSIDPAIFDTRYIEAVQLSISVAEMIAIANAKKIEYSVRMADSKLEGVFDNSVMTIFKGFYNNTFDEEFELERLYTVVIAEKPKTATIKKATTGGCYIATMAYGNYDHPQVVALRTFRDEVFLKSNLGKCFVESYYTCSPKFVDLLENHPEVNSVIRRLLDLFIGILKTGK